jgi:hypothetical protein
VNCDVNPRLKQIKDAAGHSVAAYEAHFRITATAAKPPAPKPR